MLGMNDSAYSPWTWIMLQLPRHTLNVCSVCVGISQPGSETAPLERRVFLEINQAVLDLLPWWRRSLKYWTNVAADVIFVADWETFPYCACAIFCIVQWFLNSWHCGKNLMSCTKNKPETHTRLTALCPGLPGWAGTRKVKPIWILLKQETVGGSGISWAICKSAPLSRQITTPAPHHSVFTGRMPFLPPNQQRQSTEGKINLKLKLKLFVKLK